MDQPQNAPAPIDKEAEDAFWETMRARFGANRSDPVQMTERQIEIFHEQVAAYKRAEMPDDVTSFGEARVRDLAWINRLRAKDGSPPLPNDEDGNPELTERRRKRYEEWRKTAEFNYSDER